MSTKLLLVDDHSLIRVGIISILKEKGGDFEIIEANSGEEAVKKYIDQMPDVTVMDISMEGINGMEAASEILERNENALIIILSMYLDRDYILKSMEIGVKGYVLKNEGNEIGEAVKTVLDGGEYFSSSVKEVLLKEYTSGIRSKKKEKEFSLTKREKEILKLVVEGETSQEIADKLFISVRTVDTHRANIMKKLKVNNSISLINKVNKLKLV
ncbi:response regulator transcription factor [Mangrovivirga sp. M17]|uniref:Response regulator transcription factor n=1 Tax=Mangrovivirga halotolerans TaxID=2993936 RepID=A0ABT3RPV9_9BACT|nr:response regulator transcription factor [Mangrovivirga halotolerans]MCX2743200.1 response regulator transcription factor [Mangrovivirga halotolerans]